MLELLRAGLKTDETRRFENHCHQKLNISLMRHPRVVVEANLDQVYWSLNALGLHRKKEETLARISEENVPKYPAKPWISNRQIYVGFGTLLTVRVTDTALQDRPHFSNAENREC